MMKKIILLLTLITGLFSCGSKKSEESQMGKDEYYTCSMDPQVVEYKPGNCPICKMPLTKVKKNSSLGANEIEISDQQMQLGNITIHSVGSRSFSDQGTMTGLVKLNETEVHALSAKVMGRIEKLYFKNPGDYVKQGQPVFEIYSEELNVMKQEYIQALKNQQAFEQIDINLRETVTAAKAKLLLYGLTEQQISALEKSPVTDRTEYYSPFSGYISEIGASEGQYVMLGQEVMKLADLSTVWVEGQAFNTRMMAVSTGDKVQINFPESELKSSEGEVEFVNPVSASGSRLTQFRARVDNAARLLKPGMVAYIALSKPGGKAVVALPENAVLRIGGKAIVWIKAGKNKFKRVSVEAGAETNGYVEITSGISPGDEVVVTGAYLLNSEFVFKNGATSMEGMDM